MKKLVAIVLALVMVTVLAACSSTPASSAAPAASSAAAASTAAPASTGGTDADVTIACVHRNLLGASGVNFRAAYYYEADQLGVNLMFFDGNQDVQAQSDYIEDIMSSGSADAFIVWACDADGIAASVQSIYDAEIPVITLDIAVPAESNAYVAAGNYEMGVMTGESAVEYLTELNGAPEGRVYVITATTQSTSRDRTEGFLSVIKEYPDIEVVGTYDMPTTSVDDGVALADDLIQKNPEGTVDLYFCMNMSPMLGLISSAATYNRSDFVLVGGFDYNDSFIEDMQSEDGILYSFVAQDAFAIGQKAFQLAVEAARGNMPTENDYSIPGELVTHANLDAYLANYLETQDIISSYQ